MILRELKLLTVFRGLPSGFTVTFRYNQVTGTSSSDGNPMEPLCFVGLNGSGKSNVLEVLAEIFYYLETYFRGRRLGRGGLKRFKTPFGFDIKYSLPRLVVLSHLQDWPELRDRLDKSQTDPLICISKVPNEYPEIKAVLNDEEILLQNKDNNREEGVLPTRVIGYSSGMNELLSNPFIKIDFQYLAELNQKTNNSADAKLDMNRLFFMSYDSNKYIVIANFMFDKGDESSKLAGNDLSHIKREVKVSDIARFSIQLQLEKNPSKDSNYLPSELNVALNKLIACATICEQNEIEAGKTKVRKTIKLDYWVNDATKDAFKDQFKNSYELFRALYFLQLLNSNLVDRNTRDLVINAKTGDIENLSEELPRFEKDKLRFWVHNIKLRMPNRALVDYRKLSDGEHQLLQVFGSLVLMDSAGSLFLLDEPETHFNPEWRSKFVQLLKQSCVEDRQQEVVLTTHSPFIVSDCKSANVLMFKKDPNTHSVSCNSPVDFNTFGASVNAITMKVFGQTGSIGDYAADKLADLRKTLDNHGDPDELIMQANDLLGDSVEKILFINQALDRKGI